MNDEEVLLLGNVVKYYFCQLTQSTTFQEIVSYFQLYTVIFYIYFMSIALSMPLFFFEISLQTEVT